jgi:hypothetical protein
MANEIIFDRKPYIVSYTDQAGKLQKIRRVPPPKLHEALPTDKVELTRKHSDDFDTGDVVTVKSINPRHANTLKIENSDGKTAFISYFEMNLKEKIAPRGGVSPEQTPERNQYLLWP